jgi:hypothetical protein
MDPQKRLGRIYERLLVSLKPQELPAPWNSLGSPDFFCGPVEHPDGLLGELSEKFPKKALCETGIAQTAPKHQIALADILIQPDSLFLVIRDKKSGLPVEILTQSGTLGGHDLPLFTALERGDILTVEGLDRGLVFVAFALEDVAVLRGCGIPATLASGLAGLATDQLERFCRAFGLAGQASKRVEDVGSQGQEHEQLSDRADPARESGPAIESQQDFAARPLGAISGKEADSIGTDQMLEALQMAEAFRIRPEPNLIVLAWSPASLSAQAPADFRDVADFAKDLNDLDEHVLSLEGDPCGWQPTDRDVERIRSLVQRGDRNRLRKALLATLIESRSELYSWYDNSENTDGLAIPQNYPEAVHALSKTSSKACRMGEFSRETFERERQRAWQETERLLEEQVVGPMLQEAMRVPDPVERSLRLAAAALSRMFHSRALIAADQMSQAVSRPGFDQRGARQVDSVKDVLEIADRLVKLSQEINRCDRSPRRVVFEIPAKESPSRRLDSST